MTALPQSHSPEHLEFGPRRKSFDIEAALATDWHGGSAFKTAWFNAMSMLFPLGEKFFTAFQAQEATHRRQHQRYNEMLCELRGYDLDRIERNERERIDWAYRELTARRRLAGTTASEHLTAILADEMLTQKEPMAGADPVIAGLWMWHAGQRETPRADTQYFLFPQGYAAQLVHHAAASRQVVEHP
jgi:predicted metal-dependent hydrolase